MRSLLGLVLLLPLALSANVVVPGVRSDAHPDALVVANDEALVAPDAVDVPSDVSSCVGRCQDAHKDEVRHERRL